VIRTARITDLALPAPPGYRSQRIALLLSIVLLAAVPDGSRAEDPGPQAPPATVSVIWRQAEREHPVRSGDWVPADADIRVALTGGEAARAWRLEVYLLTGGERREVAVAGLQEWVSETRKWVHTDLDVAQAAEGRWIWAGTFKAGDEIVLQWRDADSRRVAPHPVRLRMIASLGARLAFATPVALVYPVNGGATVTASAGFAVRYYRTSNTPFWRALERVGFPAVGLAYASVGGEKSVLYSIGCSMIDDQLHVYYGGFRNRVTANNFWMVGLALKTKDLAAAAGRVLK
jgi:hypothetical protein